MKYIFFYCLMMLSLTSPLYAGDFLNGEKEARAAGDIPYMAFISGRDAAVFRLCGQWKNYQAIMALPNIREDPWFEKGRKSLNRYDGVNRHTCANFRTHFKEIYAKAGGVIVAKEFQRRQVLEQ